MHYYKGRIIKEAYSMSINCMNVYFAEIKCGVKALTERHESDAMKSIMWPGLFFFFFSYQLLFGIHHHHYTAQNLASWLCNCKITLCEKYPWMTLSGVNPWLLDNHESWETCTVRWLMNTAAVSLLISARGAFEMISQRIFHPCLGPSTLRKTGNSLGMIGICYWTVHFR